MGTTVTLDPDVAAKLQSRARSRGISFKEVINDALRVGLCAQDVRSKSFKVLAKPMGQRAGVDLDRALGLAGDLEDMELMRKLTPPPPKGRGFEVHSAGEITHANTSSLSRSPVVQPASSTGASGNAAGLRDCGRHSRHDRE